MRHHLLALTGKLGAHLARCSKFSRGSVSVFSMLWHGYILHCMGDHRFCVHPDSGLASLGASPCHGNPATLVSDEELEILMSFMLGDALATK